jgi:hypothetical protein
VVACHSSYVLYRSLWVSLRVVFCLADRSREGAGDTGGLPPSVAGARALEASAASTAAGDRCHPE